MENYPLTYIIIVLEENIKGMTKRPLDKEISMGVMLGFIQPPQQENSQTELKGKETRMNEGWLSDFLEYTGWDHRDILLGMCDIPQDKGRRTPKAIQRSSGLPPHFQKGLGHRLGFNRPEDLPPKTMEASREVSTSI